MKTTVKDLVWPNVRIERFDTDTGPETYATTFAEIEDYYIKVIDYWKGETGQEEINKLIEAQVRSIKEHMRMPHDPKMMLERGAAYRKEDKNMYI